MLCPQCGADVGVDVRLCDKCSQARNAAAPEAEVFDPFMDAEEPAFTAQAEAESPQAPPDIEDAPAPADAKRSERERGPRILLAVLAVVALVALAAVVAAFFLLRRGRDAEPVQVVPESHVAVTPEATAPSITAPETTLPPVPVETSAGHLIAGRTTVNFTATHALFFPQENRLEISFFEAPPEAAVVSDAKKKGGFNIAAEDGPLVAVQFLFAQGARRCTLDALTSYTVTVAKRAPLSILSTAPAVVFIRKGSVAVRPEIPQFDCALAEGEALSVRLLDAGSLDPLSKLLFSWHLKAVTKLDDVSTEASPAGGESQAEPQALAIPANSISGGTSVVEIRSAVALFHKRHSRLEIALFAEQLKEGDIKLAAGKRSLRSAIPGRAPELILGIKFKDGTAVSDKKAIEEYFLTFFRDAVGDFYFSGPREFISFDRIGTNRAEETIDISGPLAEGGLISVSASGRDKTTRGAAIPFEWNINLQAPMFAVED